MKFYTSYFYQVRFFTPNMIPISTAKWDPKWFHDFQDNKYVFLDKRGVCNGLRADPFVLGEEYWKNLEESHNECTKDCPHDSNNCEFMKSYYNYLNTLDFDNIKARCENLALRIQNKMGFKEEPIIVLLVHEKADCPCAERPVIWRWFRDHNVEITEWSKK